MDKESFDPLVNNSIDNTPEAQELRTSILELVGRYFDSVNRGRRFEAGKTYLPAAQKVLDASDIQYLVSASLDSWLTTGRFNDEFERRLAETVGAKHARTVNSGSSANLLAVSCLTSPALMDQRLRKGDEVITVAAGFPTTVNPIVQNGLVPVFVDVELPSYNIDTRALEEAITERTRAVMVAHTLGNPFDITQVKRICKRHCLWLIEDCCDALGSCFQGQPVGSCGDIGTFSFYPAHHITMGEGGAVSTSNDQLAILLESFRDWGRDCRCPPGRENVCGNRFGHRFANLPDGYDHKYVYSHLGYNLKITDMQAAIGLSQIGKLPGFVKRRRENFSRMWDALSDLEGDLILPLATPDSEPSWFGFPITIEDERGNGAKRHALIEHLGRKRVGTRLLFAGNMIKQPCMERVEHRVHGNLVNTDKIMNDTFWIGVHPGLSDEMVDYMAQALKEFFR